MFNMIKKTKLSKKNKHLQGSFSVDVRLPDDSPTAMVENWEGAADTDETTQRPRLLKKSVRKSEVEVRSPVLSTEEYSSDSDADEGLAVNSRAKQRERRKAEKDRLRRTVFVGNLPAWMTRRALHKLFSSVLKKSKIDTVDCTIESVRLRGAVPITGGTSKQAKKRSSIRHEFAAGDKHTQIGFVVLTSTVGISTVLKLNGYLLTKDDADTGRHIRVDICSRRNPSYNTHKSVFIGNLPFSANEEEVRQVFQSFGNITNVRLVRDSATGAVKGIGFVEFEDPSSVALVIRQAALGHSGGGGDSTESQSLVVGGRQLRVEAWKSIKKSKKTKQQRRTKLGSHQEQRSVGAGSVNFRVPTNLRGAAARKEFVKRTLQKRNKRKRTNATASTAAAGKAPKTRKFGSKRSGNFIGSLCRLETGQLRPEMVVESEVFRSVRKKLDVLGYREPLGEESLSLVERLLDDLILATHGLRENKRESSSKLKLELEGQCSTLKAENSTLKNECSSLNRDISEIHERYKAQIQELSEKSRSLESVNHDLRILNSHCMKRLRTLELESKQLVKPTDKPPHANAPDTDGAGLDSPRKDSDLHDLANSNLNTSDPAPSCTEGRAQPYVCSGDKSLNEPNNDAVKMLTKRCSDLEASILLLQKERELTEKRTAALKKQIEVRNEEIDRLRRVIEVEKPPERLVLESQKGHADLVIGQLQSQVDLLQKRNEELEKRMLLRLEAISQSAFAVSSRRERASQCDLPEHPMNGKVGRYELAKLLDNFEKTNSHFLSRTDELVNCQKKMVLEIERLKRLVPPAKKQTQAVKRNMMRSTIKKTPSLLPTTAAGTNAVATTKQVTENYEPPIKEYIEGLLADRETLRAQVDHLNRSLRRWFTTGAALVTTSDAMGGDNQNAHTQSAHLEAPNVAHERDEASVGREFTSEMLKALLKATESERDYYIRRTEELQVEISRLTCMSSHHRYHGQSAALMSPKNDSEIETIKQERDMLRMTLDQFEQNLLGVQAGVRSLRSERDQLLLELEKAQKSEAPSKHPTFSSGVTASEYAQALNHQSTNSAVSNPDESLRVRASPETRRLSEYDHSEEQQLREEISALQTALSSSRTQLEASQRRTDGLERQVEELKCEVEQMTSKKEEAEKLKEQLQTALVQTSGRNSSLASELAMRKDMYNEAVRGKQLSDAMVAEAQRDLQSLNARIVEFDSEIRRSHDEVSRLRKVASQLDAEKDALQASLDDRTEDLVALKRDLDQRTHLFEENKQYLSSVELRLRQVTAMAAERDREVQTLTERLQEVETSSQVVSRSRAISEEKYAKAKDDITVLSNEVESLKNHLQAARNENNDLQCRLAEALQNFSASDQALDAKLKEHNDLLAQYGSLSKEYDAMSKRNVELERTLAEVEETLQGKEAAVRSHIDRAQKAELAALNAKRECVVAEEKCARLSTAAEKAESRAQELGGEVEEVRRDLAATRDLAGALQARLDNTAGQSVSVASDLTAKLTECERKLRDALDETAHQQEIIQQLELLLAVARENQVRLQVSLDRKTEECERLRKDTHSAHQASGVASTEALALHKQFTTHLKYASSTGATTSTSATQTAVPLVRREDHPLLFYQPLHPTPSTSSTVSLSESNCVVTAVSSATTTPRGSPTYRLASSGDAMIHGSQVAVRNESTPSVIEADLPSVTSPSSSLHFRDGLFEGTTTYVPRKMNRCKHGCFHSSNCFDGRPVEGGDEDDSGEVSFLKGSLDEEHPDFFVLEDLGEFIGTKWVSNLGGICVQTLVISDLQRIGYAITMAGVCGAVCTGAAGVPFFAKSPY
ncbi:Centrosomal protein [Echinococcus granulosus]|uniref:Centrosomal protein n=1 Tax=Echinococcus granulosus TaxID=6210 RepID=W6UDZ2_ECHGR|nr:Centrosomal protein [Echinococcus granulosus]EUB59615.1 Centrosomal protein [Echinococcus granulosus]